MSDINETEFVCRFNETAELTTALVELRAAQVHCAERMEFIKKQCQSLDELKSKCWRNVFIAAQASGKIANDAKYDDYNMHIGGLNKDQLFITPVSKESANGLPDFLKKLLT